VYMLWFLIVIRVFSFFFQSWQPPFAVDVDSFKFTPRVQRLNELEVSFTDRECILRLGKMGGGVNRFFPCFRLPQGSN